MTQAQKAPREREPEIIEFVEEVFDNKMALAMIAIGVVTGAVLIYIFIRAQDGGMIRSPFVPQTVDPTETSPQLSIVPGEEGRYADPTMPSWAQVN